MQNDSILKTFTVATLLCIVCSLIVSSAVVKLRPIQQENKILDIKKNLLLSAGLIKSFDVSKEEILQAYKKITPMVVDLAVGDFVTDISAEEFDPGVAIKDPKQIITIPKDLDQARIIFRTKYAKIYYVKEFGEIKQIILPIYGKGLWSTMYGFLAMSADLKTINGIGFYSHGETPGLGGEIDNPRWKALWKDKIAYNENLKVLIGVGKKNSSTDSSSYIDGVSGATLTMNGVYDTIHYWLGEHGYKNIIAKLKEQFASAGGPSDES